MKNLFFIFIICCLFNSCCSKKCNTVVELEGNPTTGYSWNYSVSDASVVEIQKEFVEPAQSDLMGVPGKYVFTFKPLKEGISKVVLEYKRPWETDIEPEKRIVYDISVDKKLNLCVLENK